MRPHIAIICASVALGLSGCGFIHAHEPHQEGYWNPAAPERFSENGQATVLVREVGFGVGTGAVFHEDGYVLTNWHVVAPKVVKRVGKDGTVKIVLTSGKFKVCRPTGKTEDCTSAVLIKGDPARDLAVLKTSRKFPHIIGFADDAELVPGEPLYSWGGVGNMVPPSPFYGRYVNRVAPARVMPTIEVLLIDLRLTQGGSGSPLFDRKGRCIALASGFTDLKGAALELAIPSHEIVAFLREVGFVIAFKRSREAGK